jgi:hypothetical protein
MNDIVDMKRDRNFEFQDCEPNPYPYGLRIQLCKEDLEKLGVDEMPALGDKVAFYVCGSVCSTAESQDEYGETRCVGVQIEQMSIEEPAAEEMEERKDAVKGGFKDAAKTLYKNQE